MKVAISTISNGKQMTQSLRGVFSGSNNDTILSQIATVEGENVQLFDVQQNFPVKIDLLSYDAVKSAATVTEAAAAAPSDQTSAPALETADVPGNEPYDEDEHPGS